MFLSLCILYPIEKANVLENNAKNEIGAKTNAIKITNNEVSSVVCLLGGFT